MRGMLIGAIAATLLCGCYGHAHLNDAYGGRTRAGFAAQRVATVPSASTPGGLDSEEAAVIHQNYRETIGAPRAGAKEDVGSRVLLIQPESKKDAPGR